MTRRRWTMAGFAAAILVGAAVALYFALASYSEPARSQIVAADPSDPALVALGAKVYAAQCASCHGRKLEGEPNWRSRKPDGTLPAPPHDATGHTWHHPDHLLFDYTKYGGEKLMRGRMKSAMPGFENVLSDRDIAAVLAFIKSRWPEDVRARQAQITEAYKNQK